MTFQKNNTLRKGVGISKENKDKISESMKKYWTPERREEQRARMKGKSWNPDTQFKAGVRPEESPRWKGGITFAKRKAKERDDYTCQICGLRDVEIMEVDHAVPLSINPSLKYEMSNLVTLCPNCHKRKTLREIKEGIYKTKKQTI